MIRSLWGPHKQGSTGALLVTHMVATHGIEHEEREAGPPGS